MYRLTVLYGHPTDPDAFDSYYRDVHIPIARRMRGLTDWTLSWCSRTDNSPYHLIADLYTEDEASMNRILESPEGRAASADVEKFATGGAVFVAGTFEKVALE